MTKPSGTRIITEVTDCRCPKWCFTNADWIDETVRTAISAVKLGLVDSVAHTFKDPRGEDSGVTYLAILKESHLAIHAWPEFNYVDIDVYVCNYSESNAFKAEKLCDRLSAAWNGIQTSRKVRG